MAESTIAPALSIENSLHVAPSGDFQNDAPTGGADEDVAARYVEFGFGRGGADADAGICGCAADTVDATQDERIVLRDDSVCADGGGVGGVVCGDICARADDRVKAARSISDSGSLSHGDVAVA